MFILTGINVNADLVSIYDTKDNTNERVRLSVVADRLHNNKIRVKGLNTKGVGVYLEWYNIFVNFDEAKLALRKVYARG